MQKLVAKYGVAAHLAFLAVAPLFLFPFFGKETVAVVQLWLSLSAFVWLSLEPSLRRGERLHDARRRVFWQMMNDPLFWASLLLIAFTGLRLVNTGIGLAYDAEASAWRVSDPIFPILPGSVGFSGFLPFAASVALSVLLQGCRHSLGRSARSAFLLVSSVLAGLAAVVALVVAHGGGAQALDAVKCPLDGRSYVGVAFALYFLCGTVALVGAFEHHWNLVMPLFPLAIGGTAVGAFVFSPAYVSAVAVLAEVILLGYAFAFACKTLPSSGEFKMMVVYGLSLVLGGLLVVALLDETSLMARVTPFTEMSFFSEDFWKTRAALSEIAFRAWISHLWVGSGLDAFPLDFRFFSTPEDWTLLPRGAAFTQNGWWQILSERGIVGTVFFVLPFGFLVFAYGRRLADWIATRTLPHPACLLLVLTLALVVALGFADCSFIRADVLLAMGAMLAVSASAFPRTRRSENG